MSKSIIGLTTFIGIAFILLAITTSADSFTETALYATGGITLSYSLYKIIENYRSSKCRVMILKSLDKSRFTRKMVERIDDEEIVKKALSEFKPLSDAQLINFTGKFPELRNKFVNNRRYRAADGIFTYHREGAAYVFGQGSENDDFRRQIQFIVYSISKIDDRKKQREEMSNFVEALEPCPGIAHGYIDSISKKFAGQRSGFAIQVGIFIDNFKEKALERAIPNMVPHLKNPRPCSNPREEFNHIKAGFGVVYAPVINLEIKGASMDRYRNETYAHRCKSDFAQYFVKQLDREELIKEFIIEINGLADNYLINLDCYNWIAKEFHDSSVGLNVYYLPEVSYPAYSPSPTVAQRDMRYAYIDYAAAVKILQKLGYLK